jgi:hypothetical protein
VTRAVLRCSRIEDDVPYSPKAVIMARRVNMNARTCLAILAVVSVLIASEQQRPRCPVDVQHQGEDVVGQRLVYRVRECIRKSESFRDADPGESHALVLMQTFDARSGTDEAGLSTVCCVMWLVEHSDTSLYPMFIGENCFTGGGAAPSLDHAAEVIVGKALDVYGGLKWLWRKPD